jgi:hypothetical protein
MITWDYEPVVTYDRIEDMPVFEAAIDRIYDVNDNEDSYNPTSISNDPYQANN